jgi:hypothetical protein
MMKPLCSRGASGLTVEQNEWLSPQRPDPLFDGTIRAVINRRLGSPTVAKTKHKPAAS